MSHLCGSQIYGFSYIDEEGDPIPARDDGDYRAMVGLYEWMQNDPTTAGPITVSSRSIVLRSGPHCSVAHLCHDRKCVHSVCAIVSTRARLGSCPLVRHIDLRTLRCCAAAQIQLELEEPRPARNKLGLTVDIGGPAVDHDDGAAAVEGFGQVFDALGGGEILESDLEFGCVLGSGSGGTVYSTLHKPSQMAMAVKVIPIDASAEMQRHILAELEILHRCDSPHIIR
jgi:hypothetical protein